MIGQQIEYILSECQQLKPLIFKNYTIGNEMRWHITLNFIKLK